MPLPEIFVIVLTQTNVATTQKHHTSSRRRNLHIAHYLVKNKHFVTALNKTRNKEDYADEDQRKFTAM